MTSARAIESDFDSAGFDADKQLWCGVILQQVHDALGMYSNDAKTPQAKDIQKDTAQNWLLKNRDDFYMVCEMAGINPKKARMALRMILSRL